MPTNSSTEHHSILDKGIGYDDDDDDADDDIKPRFDQLGLWAPTSSGVRDVITSTAYVST
jgi:hypothetical protein